MIHLTRWRTVAVTTTAAALAAGAFGIGAAVSNPPAAPSPIELTSEGAALTEPVEDGTLVPSVDDDPRAGEVTAGEDGGGSPTDEVEDGDDVDSPSDEVVTPDAAPTEAAAPGASPVEADSPDEADDSDEVDDPDDSDLPDEPDESDDSDLPDGPDDDSPDSAD